MKHMRDKTIDMIVEACSMVAHGYTTAEIKRYFKSKYGFRYKTTERYVAHARAFWRKALEADKAEVFQRNIGRLEALYREAEGFNDRIKVVREMNRMWGFGTASHTTTINVGEMEQPVKYIRGVSECDV